MKKLLTLLLVAALAVSAGASTILAIWHLDNNGDDSSGNGYTLDMSSIPFSTTHCYGTYSAGTFPFNDYIRAPEFLRDALANQAQYRISCYFYLNSLSTTSQVVWYAEGSNATYLSVSSSTLTLTNNAGSISAVAAISTGTCYLADVIGTATNTTLYLNRVKIAESGVQYQIGDVSTGFTMGYFGHVFDGYIDEFRVWIGPELTATPTRTPANTRTATITSSRTRTRTVTSTPTPNWTRTPTTTVTRSLTPTPTKTATRTPSFTATPSVTSTNSFSPTRSLTPTFSPTRSVTFTPTPTVTRSLTPTPTPTRSLTPTPTPTRSRTPTPTPSITQTATITGTPTPSAAHIHQTQTMEAQMGTPYPTRRTTYDLPKRNAP